MRRLALAIAVLSLAVPAHAGLLTYTSPFSNEAPPVIPRFDPAAGRLDSVSLDISGTVVALFASAIPVRSGILHAEVEVVLPGLLSVIFARIDLPFDLGAPDPFPHLFAPFVVHADLDPTLWDRFTGSGTVPLSALGVPPTIAPVDPPDADPRLDRGSGYSGTLTVAYGFSPVPEPPSLLMGCVAISLCWALMARRRSCR